MYEARLGASEMGVVYVSATKETAFCGGDRARFQGGNPVDPGLGYLSVCIGYICGDMTFYGTVHYTYKVEQAGY